MAAMRILALLILAALAPAADARTSLRSQMKAEPAAAVAMAATEGVACTDDEYTRYKTIVCKVEKECQCGDTVCKLDWCSEYVHTWKKEFGACILKGCPP
mmetsp:Transcript_105391/g.183303  ORF Transcript_105391/g.183303 Transcript_105391/m.183303 type:complete len:100 (+) Transcript_105391:84-383(+)